MKKILHNFPLLLFSLFCISCTKSNDKVIDKNSNIAIDTSKSYHSNLDSQKATLLAINENLSPEKVCSVINQYHEKTFFLLDNSPEYLSKVIDTIANSNNLSKRRTASIIFSYEYEIQTKQEVVDDYLESQETYESTGTNKYDEQ